MVPKNANSTSPYRVSGREKVITYLDISLFESPAQALVNTVNTVGVMGKGIAKIFKDLYPDMFQRYRHFCDDKNLDIGKLYIYRTPNKTIINFPTKKHWRNPSHISYIEAGLQKFVTTYEKYGISSVSFPQLGCGHGELNWDNEVQPLMEKYLKPLPIPVYIHLYPKSPDFVPERLDRAFAREILLERQRVSVTQVWEDLDQLVSTTGPHLIDMSVQIHMDADCIYFKSLDKNATICKDDLEDFWNVFRIHGTMAEADVPQQIIDQHVNGSPASLYFFKLLSLLNYVNLISLGIRRDGKLVHEQGLHYVPSANVDILIDSEINI